MRSPIDEPGQDMSPAAFLAEVHEIATGKTLSVGEAWVYFHDPGLLARVVRDSGALADANNKSRQLQYLLNFAPMADPAKNNVKQLRPASEIPDEF